MPDHSALGAISTDRDLLMANSKNMTEVPLSWAIPELRELVMLAGPVPHVAFQILEMWSLNAPKMENAGGQHMEMLGTAACFRSSARSGHSHAWSLG